MATMHNVPATESSNEGLYHTVALLGGEAVFHQPFQSTLEVHAYIMTGFPGSALTHLRENIGLLNDANLLEHVLGVSKRTLLRRKQTPELPLDQALSSRAWKFAELVSRASDVLGSQQAAEEWLVTPAIGLENHRPIDLLSTLPGIDIVETYLERMDSGVYQ